MTNVKAEEKDIKQMQDNVDKIQISLYQSFSNDIDSIIEKFTTTFNDSGITDLYKTIYSDLSDNPSGLSDHELDNLSVSLSANIVQAAMHTALMEHFNVDGINPVNNLVLKNNLSLMNLIDSVVESDPIFIGKDLKELLDHLMESQKEIYKITFGEYPEPEVQEEE